MLLRFISVTRIVQVSWMVQECDILHPKPDSLENERQSTSEIRQKMALKNETASSRGKCQDNEMVPDFWSCEWVRYATLRSEFKLYPNKQSYVSLMLSGPGYATTVFQDCAKVISTEAYNGTIRWGITYHRCKATRPKTPAEGTIQPSPAQPREK
ncbi:hypothetical protein GUJ93_ZPchr0007g3941 [Zizania palustris]|uniref:Uncharacterized protein n=1 Tax=Zizania palustris TaxID=103762 RepID=A0A8J5SU29_ZIZPA|nr:hypothetical protein GUJ93_ZPchr0007g3941 [Zizania palustris]